MPEYFRPEELACPCCGVMGCQPIFLDRLNLARGYAGVPFQVTSGYRCAAHNREVGGVDDSSHVLGFAADISAPTSAARLSIVRGAIQAGFRRIGVGGTFIHLDCDPGKQSGVMWMYP